MDERVPHPLILPGGAQPGPHPPRADSNSHPQQPNIPQHSPHILEIPPFANKQKRSPHPSDPQAVMPSIPHPPRRANSNPNPKPNPKPQRKPREQPQKSILPREQPFQYPDVRQMQNPGLQQQYLNQHPHLPNYPVPHSHPQNSNTQSHQQYLQQHSHQHPHPQIHNQHSNLHSNLPQNPNHQLHLHNSQFQNRNNTHVQNSIPHLQHTNPHLQNLNPHSQNPHLQNPLLAGAQLSPSHLHAQRQQLITAYMGSAQPFLLPTGGIPAVAPPPQNPQTLPQKSPAPKYTQVESIVAEMRENMIKVLKTSNYKRCKSAKNIRQALREVRTLCKEMRNETTVLGKQKVNARRKATPEGDEGPAKKQKLADGAAAKSPHESPEAGAEDKPPTNLEEGPKVVDGAGDTPNGETEPRKREDGLSREGVNPGGERGGRPKGSDGNDRTVSRGGAETDGVDDRGEETDSDNDVT